jgi:GxxExxY protein
MPKPKAVIQDAPWLKLTYAIIGLAMQVHNELGPGHREAVYHDAMAAKLQQAGLNFEDEPYIPISGASRRNKRWDATNRQRING